MNTNGPAHRRKRVVRGQEFLDSTEYLSVRYFVWIGNGNECDLPLPDVLLKALGKHSEHELPVPSLGFICTPSKHHLRCTGSLLMPQVVQTACHCIVDFIAKEGELEERPVKFNVNEKRYHIYPGKNAVSSMTNGRAAQRYIHHPACYQTRSNSVFDYALIVLEQPMYPFQIIYAPTYSLTRLTNLWTDLMSKGKICLAIGFGSYLEQEGPNSQTKSAVLLHGWMRTLDYMSCYDQTFLGIGTYRYRQKATWFCLTKIPDHNTISSGHGDSGGPITCDNEYVGVVSYSLGRINVPAATAFTPLENAAEYRRHLEKYLEDTEDVMYTTKDPVGYKYMPTSPPINMSDFRWEVASIAIRPDAKLIGLLVGIMLSIKFVINSYGCLLYHNPLKVVIYDLPLLAPFPSIYCNLLKWEFPKSREDLLK